ncbi:unnamed protein product [Tetraodon nigroviridis]|uniref:(spotted green pufferfish) hypothetical protein n=1 Tax=Tetraodon nigroviridis TaxID=99883 RepID=Q4RIF8_TETNG|nr:unnamed protein product [Tetraodon nigroviridis]
MASSRSFFISLSAVSVLLGSCGGAAASLGRRANQDRCASKVQSGPEGSRRLSITFRTEILLSPQSLIIPGKSPTRKKSGPFSSRRSSAIGIENIQEVQERSREVSPSTQKTLDNSQFTLENKPDNSSDPGSPEFPTLKNRAASIPEAQDISRSSSNASSFASVVEENEGEEDYDTGQQLLSSSSKLTE